jgi:hypothetical protein
VQGSVVGLGPQSPAEKKGGGFGVGLRALVLAILLAAPAGIPSASAEDTTLYIEGVDVWAGDGGFSLEKDLVILPGATLTIGPYATVTVSPGKRIIVQGELIVTGGSYLLAANDRWGQIYGHPGSVIRMDEFYLRGAGQLLQGETVIEVPSVQCTQCTLSLNNGLIYGSGVAMQSPVPSPEVGCNECSFRMYNVEVYAARGDGVGLRTCDAHIAYSIIDRAVGNGISINAPPNTGCFVTVESSDIFAGYGNLEDRHAVQTNGLMQLGLYNNILHAEAFGFAARELGDSTIMAKHNDLFAYYLFYEGRSGTFITAIEDVNSRMHAEGNIPVEPDLQDDYSLIPGTPLIGAGHDDSGLAVKCDGQVDIGAIPSCTNARVVNQKPTVVPNGVMQGQVFEKDQDMVRWIYCAAQDDYGYPTPRMWFSALQGPHAFAGVGTQTVFCQAVDAFGLMSGVTYASFEIRDTLPPDTSILQGPEGEIASAQASFVFESLDPEATFQCQVDGGSYAPCVSAQVFSGFQPGPHTFAVRAKDLNGNLDPEPAVWMWTVAPIAPGGGVVDNARAYIADFANTGPTQEQGEEDVFGGQACDANGEGDLLFIRLRETMGRIASMHRAIEAADLERRTEPTSFGLDDFKVWNEIADDACISFRVRLVYPAVTGTLGFLAGAADEAALSFTAPLLLSIYVPLYVEPLPVNMQGQSVMARWGGWNALPGARDVSSVNFMKIVNGRDPAARVTLDFNEDAFKGLTRAGHGIPLAGNIRFAVWEDRTLDVSYPAEGAEALTTMGEISFDGSLTVSFTTPGAVMYVGYQLVQLPDVLADQDYGAAFTVTQV